jgi:Ni,Fe-hydrogenase III component G
MAESTTMTDDLAMAERLVGFLEQDGFGLEAAVWTTDEDDRWRLLLVPRDRSDDKLRQMIKVAYTISTHRDELPGRHRLSYSVVDPDEPVIKAIRPLVPPSAQLPREVGGHIATGLTWTKLTS